MGPNQIGGTSNVGSEISHKSNFTTTRLGVATPKPPLPTLVAQLNEY